MKIRNVLTTASVTLFCLAAVQIAWAQPKNSRNANEYDETARMGMFHAVLSESSRANGLTAQARTHAEKAVLLLENPSDDFEFYSLGVAYEELENYDLALANFDKAIQLDPQKFIAYIRRGRVYSRKGNYDRALADFDKAIELDGADVKQSKSSSKKNDNDLPTPDIQKLIQRDPRPWFDYFRLADVYLERGKTFLKKDDNDRAIADFTKTIQLDSKRATAYNARGVAYGNKGDFDRAIADFDKAIELKPLLKTAHYNRGLAFSRKGDEARARADFDKEEQLFPAGEKAEANSLPILNQRAVRLEKPRYPDDARRNRASGAVVVKVLVDEKGRVLTADAISGPHLFWDVCVEAAKNSLFKPTLLAGTPVRVTGVIQYHFVAQ